MKINIKSIEFRNLFSYGNKWQEFSPEGICFITGLNKNNDRRNFTGKSNLLKMFPYSIFGKVEGLTKSRTINWRNKKNAESYIHFNKKGIEYTIHRGMKPDILEVYENGKLLPLPPNKKDQQLQIEKEILETDYNSFMNIVYADTNNSASILKMDKPTKRKFLEQVFNLDYYTKMKDSANTKLRSIESKIEKTEQDIKNNKIRTSDIKSEISKYKNELGKLNDSNTEYTKIKEEIDKRVDEYNEAKKEFENFDKEIKFIEERKNKLQEKIIKFDQKIKEVNRKIISDNKDIDVKSLKDKIELFGIQKKKLSEEMSALENKIDKYNEESLSQEKDTLISEISEIKTNNNIKKKELDRVKKEEEEKPDKGECPFCHQEIDHQLLQNYIEIQVESLVSDIYKFNNLYEEKNKRYKEVISDLDELKSNKDKLVKTKDKISDIDNKTIGVQEEINEYNEYQKLIEKSKKYEKVLGNLKRTREIIYNEKKELNTHQENLYSEVDKTGKFIKNYDKLKDKLEVLKVSVEKEKEQRERIKGWIEDYNIKYQELTSSIKNDKNSVAKLKQMKDYLKVIKDLCSDEKAKQYTISNKIPLLNKKVNEYLSSTGVDYYVKINNWLNTEIRGPGRKDCVYENLSGAEKISLDRALQFSFNDISKIQSSDFMDLLILDEILDSSVDSIGMKNIVEIVRLKQQRDDSNVLIVSHRESFDEMENFIDNFYRIEYDGSYSKIVKI